jgi:Flp pilus assembly protein TadB
MLLGVLAAGCGGGLWVLVRGLFPPPRPLRTVAEELRQPRAVALAFDPGVRGRWQRFARRLSGRSSQRHAAELALVQVTPERHMLDKLGYCASFGAIGLFPALLFPFFAVGVPASLPLLVALALAVLGWTYPDVSLRNKANEARKAWAHALAVFTDIVAIELAGGAGVEEALLDAAAAGQGPQLEQLAAALQAAHTRRQRMWDAIDELGTMTDIAPLRELAAAMTLAGESGSRVRETLTAKATALRTRQLAEAEAEANKASETMGVAPALMAVAAVALIAYPALAAFMG